MQNVNVYRPKGNLVWGYVAIGFDALYLSQSVLYPTKSSVLALDIAAAGAIAAAATLLWIRPKLVLRDNDLVVVNPVKTETISYRDITELETKWSLLIVHGSKKTRVWVAPANGKQRWIADSTFRWRSDRVPTSAERTNETTSISSSLNSDSGVAAHLIRERVKHLH